MASKEIDGYSRTPGLRFVEREEPGEIVINQGTGEHYHSMRIVRILQQLWTSEVVGEKPEWRDVPVSREHTEEK